MLLWHYFVFVYSTDVFVSCNVLCFCCRLCVKKSIYYKLFVKCNALCAVLKNFMFRKQICWHIRLSRTQTKLATAADNSFSKEKKSFTLHPFRTNTNVYCACSIGMRIKSHNFALPSLTAWKKFHFLLNTLSISPSHQNRRCQCSCARVVRFEHMMMVCNCGEGAGNVLIP